MELFVTCGLGLEPFAITELKDKFDIKSDSSDENPYWKSFPGKLFFKTNVQNNSEVDGEVLVEDAKVVKRLIHGLKTVERIMGVAHVDNTTHSKLSKRDLLPALFEMGSRAEVKSLLKRWAAIKEINETSHADAEAETGEIDADEANHDELPPIKKPRLPQDAPNTVGFRVNVRLTGWFKTSSNSWEVSKTIGSAISKNMSDEGWSVNLRNPNLEISVFLTDNGIIFAVPMTKKPVSERAYLAHSPLRSTIANAMASLVFDTGQENEPKFILDPMCGTGTILVEVALNFKPCMIYGIDIDPNQISKCRENVIKANVEHQVSLLQTDSRNCIPLQIQFDSIICDMPFGRQHGTRQETLADMPQVIRVMNECLKPNGRIALLISAAMSTKLEECILHSSDSSVDWKLLQKYPVKLGELPAVIYAFKKFKLNP